MGLARFVKAATGALPAQEDRWPLWLPVALGAGAALYFALAAEPPPLFAGAALALAAGLTLSAFRMRPAGMRMLLALAAMAILGLGLAKLRQERVAAPVLDHAVTAHMTGRVAAVETRSRGERVLLTDIVSGAFGGPPPAQARITFTRRDPLLAPGAWIGVTARLLPPPAPAMPGAADYGRADYFARVGAVGFAYGAAYPGMAARALTVGERVGQSVERLRWRMTGRIQAVLPGSTGAIAAALITGSRGGIADEDEEALRDAGLAHVLAIAGLHMALVGGGLFWLVRALLATVPALALRHPIKKWAAVAALAMSTFYLVISGAAPSAVRAFVMLAAALAAVLVDRPVLSMRSLALAAAILLVLRPEAVTEPGFQMSFAAVAALVAVAEWEAGRRVRRGALWRHIRAIALTSLIASLATLPYAIFHFGRATHYAVLGNLLAMPVMGLWVMPSAALSVAAMPLGWEAGPLHLLGWGIGVMLALGRFVSGLPGAVSALPAMPMAALVLVSLGGLWWALWRGKVRWLGGIGIAAGVVVMLAARPPDVLIAPDGLTVALRGPKGLAFVSAPADAYVARAWLAGAGQEDAPFAMAPARCDGLGCVARLADGRLLAVGRRPEAAAQDCARAALVISAAETLSCPQALFAAGRAQLAQAQGYAVTGSRVESVRAWRGTRPWVQ